MNIIADENIPFAEEAFSTLGKVKLCAGREIDNAAMSDTDLLFVRSITKVNESLVSGSPLKFAATATIGTDHIDQDFLKSQGIGFFLCSWMQCKIQSANTFCLVFLNSASAIPSQLQIKQSASLALEMSARVSKKKCRGLGMKVVLNDPPLAQETGHTKYRPIEEILQQADIITIHVSAYKNRRACNPWNVECRFSGSLETRLHHI